MSEDLNLFNYFHTVDEGQQPDVPSIFTSFIQEKVLVYQRNADTDPKDGDGQMLIDRGWLLLQRNTQENILYLAMFAKDKKDDNFPDLVIPLASLVDIEKKTIVSRNGNQVRGRVRLHTKCSLNMLVSMKPWIVTIKLPVSDVDTFMEACREGIRSYDQRGLVFNKWEDYSVVAKKVSD